MNKQFMIQVSLQYMTQVQVETWFLENIANFTIIFGAFLLCRNKRFLESIIFIEYKTKN